MKSMMSGLLTLASVLIASWVPGFAQAVAFTVYTVNYPLQYFAERIGGTHVEVRFPAPADTDPAFWMPDPDTVAAYQQADLVLLNGAGYARWVGQASLSRRRLVNTSAAFKDRYIAVEDSVSHSHGPQGKHAHAELAFTTWLDFEQALLQAQAIAAAFIRKAPQLEADFRRSLTALENDLKELDQAIKALVKLNPEQRFIGSHPVYQYFARRYRIKLQSVHWEPDTLPDNRQWSELAVILNSHPARWMIWENSPLEAANTKLRAKGIGSLVFDPSANQPDQGDFLTVMRRNIENLRRAYIDL